MSLNFQQRSIKQNKHNEIMKTMNKEILKHNVQSQRSRDEFHNPQPRNWSPHSRRFLRIGRFIIRHHLHDHPLPFLTVSTSAADEVKSSWSVELEDGVSSVGEEARLCGVTSFVLFVRHFHHRILLVPET